MTRTAAWLAISMAAIVSAGPAFAEGALDPSGVWLTESGTSKVRIARCGGGYCGTIVATGGSGIDSNNPDPALKTRKLVGVQILQATSPSGGGYSGNLYNPTDGKTYSGSLTPKGPNRVEVAGCVLRVLCKSQTWTRIQ